MLAFALWVSVGSCEEEEGNVTVGPCEEEEGNVAVGIGCTSCKEGEGICNNEDGGGGLVNSIGNP